MKLLSKLSMLITLFSALTGCSMNHYIARDYDQYLMKNEVSGKFEKTAIKADYLLTPNTAGHHYEFRSATVGYANLWIVEFGKLLESSLQSKDIQESFRRLTKVEGAGVSGDLIVFDLKQYEFADYGARVDLAISVSKNGVKVFDKTYQSDGKTQGGKMFWGGVFAMKNAIQQSSKLAIDEIMHEFIRDIVLQI